MANNAVVKIERMKNAIVKKNEKMMSREEENSLLSSQKQAKEKRTN